MRAVVDDFAACCCSHDIAVKILMSFEITTEHCFEKGVKTEEKRMLKNT